MLNYLSMCFIAIYNCYARDEELMSIGNFVKDMFQVWELLKLFAYLLLLTDGAFSQLYISVMDTSIQQAEYFRRSNATNVM